jgi:hypothetical protein
MDYLLYARTFWSERDGVKPFAHDWHTDCRWLWRKARRGDRLWIVIAAPKEAAGEWRLLERLEVARPDPAVRRNGRKYRIVGSPRKSRAFDYGERQRDLAPILKRLEFPTGRRIQETGSAIGRSIRGPRRLADADIERLEAFASRLGRHRRRGR